MKRLVAGCALAVGLVLAGAGVANAGEATGNGKESQGANHASSECAFSGQDTPDAIENPPTAPDYNPMFNDDGLAVRGNQKNGYHGIQSYGMFVKAGLKDMVPSPGMACRGNAEAPPEG